MKSEVNTRGNLMHRDRDMDMEQLYTLMGRNIMGNGITVRNMGKAKRLIPMAQYMREDLTETRDMGKAS
jgi:hypothetical protein